jgi:hypothetical protein
MNYPFTDAEWLREALPKTTLYRRVSVGLLTLGHLRTAEAVGVRLLTSAETAEKAENDKEKASAELWGRFFNALLN